MQKKHIYTKAKKKYSTWKYPNVFKGVVGILFDKCKKKYSTNEKKNIFYKWKKNTWKYPNVFKGVVGILAPDWIANWVTSTQMQFALQQHILKMPKKTYSTNARKKYSKNAKNNIFHKCEKKDSTLTLKSP